MRKWMVKEVISSGNLVPDNHKDAQLIAEMIATDWRDRYITLRNQCKIDQERLHRELATADRYQAVADAETKEDMLILFRKVNSGSDGGECWGLMEYWEEYREPEWYQEALERNP